MKTVQKYFIGLGFVLFIVMFVNLTIQTSSDQHAAAVQYSAASKTRLASLRN